MFVSIPIATSVQSMAPRTLANRVLQFPLTRIVVGFAVCFIPITLSYARPYKIITGGEEPQNLIFCVIAGTLILATYYYFFRFYERRKMTELSASNFGRNTALGLLAGFLLQSLVVFIMFAAGDYKVLSINNVIYCIPGLEISFVSAITEEIIFRGILFRITEEKLGSVVALFISSLLFGVVHLYNPGASTLAVVNIFIEAGLLLGAAYIYSRSLWLPIAIHFSWNFAESGIYGVPDSGLLLFNSLISSKQSGNALITGGEFGPEASVQCLLLGFIASLLLLYLSQKEGKFIKSFWVKNTLETIN
jgi:CAAX protease family protein